MGGALKKLVAVAACALALTSCASTSYQEAAMQASDIGDQKTATSLARKEVARFTGPDHCSSTNNLNCGTLALAYGTLASYQILDRDRAGGEESFRNARQALRLVDPPSKASATAMVYRDGLLEDGRSGPRHRRLQGRPQCGRRHVSLHVLRRPRGRSASG